MTPQPVSTNTKKMQLQAELLTEIYEQMLIIAYAKMRNKADALDVVQESWTIILSKWEMLRDKDKLMPWAKKIVNNTANNTIRRKLIYQNILREKATALYTHHTEPSVEQLLENKEITAAILSLPRDL